jgi:hypothetical protein
MLLATSLSSSRLASADGYLCGIISYVHEANLLAPPLAMPRLQHAEVNLRLASLIVTHSDQGAKYLGTKAWGKTGARFANTVPFTRGGFLSVISGPMEKHCWCSGRVKSKVWSSGGVLAQRQSMVSTVSCFCTRISTFGLASSAKLLELRWQ